MKKHIVPSEFKDLKGIEYFNFEEDFMEDNVRCIPMIVRFKMDAVGIKLKLSEWSKFSAEERIELAIMQATDSATKVDYYIYLLALIEKYTKQKATIMPVDLLPAWGQLTQLPALLIEKTKELNVEITLQQWGGLSDIQRFALLKLCRPGHENKNFPKAMLEFGLT